MRAQVIAAVRAVLSHHVAVGVVAPAGREATRREVGPILELEPYLEEFYRRDVIGGPGAFVVAAETFQDFGTAILRKLILEIAHPAGEPATTPGAA